jgi:transcriptional regulator with XRE-family HTH domain
MPDKKTNKNRDIILKSFGTRVRQLRKDLGLTQEELSFRCGIHTNYLSSVERGERNIALINIDALARGLGVSISNLFDFDIIVEKQRLKIKLKDENEKTLRVKK